MTGLTREQAACLDAIGALTEGHVSPTLAELGTYLGRSKSKIHATLTILRQRGAIDWLPGRARSIRVCADQFSNEALARLSTAELKDLAHRVYGILADRKVAS